MLIQSFLFASILLVGQALAQNGRCSANSFRPSPSAACISCPTNSGRSRNAGEGSCTCSSGLVSSSGSSTTDGAACNTCGSDTYRISYGFSFSCSACPSGSGRLASSSDLTCACDTGLATSSGSSTTNSASCNSCAKDYYYSSYFLGYSYECLQCPAGSTKEAGFGTTCACIPGFTRSGNSGPCTECPAGSYINGSTCSPCGSGFFSTAPGSSTCTRCPAGSSPNSSKTGCSCNNGVYNAGANTCSTCDKSATLNSSGQCTCNSNQLSTGSGFSLKCGQTCPNGSTVSGDTCKCSNGVYNVGSNTCTQCSSNASGATGECVCNSGFAGNGRECTQCPSDAEVKDGKCVCKGGFAGDGNTCKQCSSDAEVKDGKCVCKGGFAGNGSTCAKCPVNSMSNSDNTACQCSASFPNAVGSGAQLTCTKCSSVATYNPGTKKCECANGFRHQDATSNQAATCINDMNGSAYYRSKKRAHEQIKMIASPSGQRIEISAFSARHARSCSRRQVACSLGRRGAFVCRDVLSDLEQCGACWDMPSTQDCTAIPGIDEVLCVEGKCVIKACDSKHSLKDGKCV